MEMQRIKEHSALKRLQEISVKLLGQLELDPLLESILQGLVDLVQADKGQILRYDPQRNESRNWVSFGVPKEVAEIVYKPGDGLATEVLVTGQPLKVDDYDSWEGRDPYFPRGIVGPLIMVTVKRGEEFLGALTAARDPGKAPFSDEDVEILQLFANQAAVAIANARLYQEAKRSAEELTSLYDTSLEITKQLDLTEVLERIIQRAVELAKGNYGQFYFFDENHQELVPAIPYHLPEPLQVINLKPGEGLSGKVLSTRQPLVVNDYDSWEGRSPQVPPGISERGVGVPVEHGERVLGVLTVNRGKEDPLFTEEDIRLLTLFANQAAVAIANARLYEETRRTSEQLSKLYETSLEITQQLDLFQVLEGIIRRGVELAGARFGQLYLYDEQRQELRGPVTYNLPESMHGYVIKPGEGLTGKVLVSRKPMVVEDYDNWEGRLPQVPKGMGYYSAAVPVEHGDQVLGVFWVSRNLEDGAFTEQDIKLLTLLANQAAVAIANARLYEETKRSAEQLSSLYETSLELAGQLELDPLLQSIIKRVVDLLDAEIGEFYRYDPQRKELHPVVPIRLPDTAIVVLKPGEGVAGKVLLSGEPLRVDNYDAWEGRSPQWPMGFTGPALGVPVKRVGEFLGVITAGRNTGKKPFNEEDVELLQLYANQVAVAIANARLYEETRRSAQQLSRLYETSIDITRQLELDPLLKSILENAFTLLDSVMGEIYRYDPQRQELIPSIPYGLSQEVTVILKPGEGVAGKILLTGQPIKVDDYDSWEGRSPQWPYGLSGPTLGAPVKRGEEFLGVITTARSPGEKPFSEEDLVLLQLFASQAAVAIANAQLYEETRSRAGELSDLYETSLELASQLEPQKLLESIALRAWRLLQGKVAEIVLYDPKTQALRDAVLVSRGELRPPSNILTKPGEGIDGRVFLSGEPLIIENYNTWEGRVPGVRRVRASRMASVPIKHGDQTLGTLKIRRFTEDSPFTQEEVRLLTLFANQAAVAISNARLYEGTKRSAEELSSLYDASLEMASQLKPQKLLEAIVLRAERLLRGQNSEIVLYDPHRQLLFNAVGHGDVDPYFRTGFLKPGEGADGKVFSTGQPLTIDDYNTWEGRVPDAPPHPFPRGAIVPIKLGKETLGTLKVTRRLEGPQFTQEDVRLLTLFANQAAVAIANARLYEETKRSAVELSRLYETSIDITRQLAVPKLLEAIMIRAADLLYGSGGIFFLFNPSTGKLHPEGMYRRRTDFPQVPLAPGHGLAGKIFLARKPMSVEDYETWEGRSPEYIGKGLARLGGAPMILGDKCLGVIIVDRQMGSPTFNEEDLRLLSLFANQAAVALTNAQQYEELQKLYSQVKDKERLESELRVAHNIQASLLPQQLPKIRGWEVEALWVPARTISGDFYDVFPVPGGKWGFVIADVAGKGVPAALFMALCRTLVRTFCMDGRPPREAIARANDLILADAQTDWFVTLFYGLLDPKWGIFSYVNAGHPPPLWYRHTQEKIEGLRADGMALGIVSEIKLKEKSVQLEPGDLVFLYTDGLSEAADPQDRLFGVNRLRALFRGLADSGPVDILQDLQKAIAAFAQGRETADDIAAVIIKRSGRR